MMHFYAQHTATRNWFAAVLTLDEVEKAREAGLPMFIALYLIGESGFGSVAEHVVKIVGEALERAAHRTTTGRGRN